jgi:ATP-dependent RNA helicase DDX46/PRP5
VAGRGLDVSDLNLVVNYNCPNHLEEYVHRVGRTGRAGRKGTAVTFVADPDDAKYASDLIFALKASEQKVPDYLMKMAEDFATKVAAGTEKKHQSGYRTKGFAFEDGADSGGYTGQVKKMRSALYEEIRAAEKEETGNNEGEVGIDAEGEAIVEESTEKPVAPTASPSPPPSAPVQVNSTGTTPSQPTTTTVVSSVDPIKAEVERIKAEEIAKAKALGSGLAAASSTMPGVPTSTHAGGSRFGQRPQQPPQQPQHGMQEIDMNDLPAVVRQKMMAKRFLNNIENDFKVSVTVKGRVFPAGTKPGTGEQKLTMIIESHNPQHVKNAVAELNRFIHQEARGLTADQAFEHVTGSNATKYRF